MPLPIPKDLIAASATPLILAVLSRGDSYGYAIIRDIREGSGGVLAWTEGMLYPVLHRLEGQDYVAARWEGEEGGRRRKYYRITPAGREALALLLEQWRVVDETIEEFSKERKDVRS